MDDELFEILSKHYCEFYLFKNPEDQSKKYQKIIQEYKDSKEKILVREIPGVDESWPFRIAIGKSIFRKNVYIATAVFIIDPLSINNIIYEDDPKSGLGESGEVYLVGSDFEMKSNSRFKGYSFGNTTVQTESVQQALNGNEDVGIFKDYRGVEVLSAYAALKIPGLRWVLLAEIDYKEAIIPIQTSKGTIMFISIILMTVTFLLAFLISKRISSPIIKLKNATIDVGEGNFDLQLEKKH